MGISDWIYRILDAVRVSAPTHYYRRGRVEGAYRLAIRYSLAYTLVYICKYSSLAVT